MTEGKDDDKDKPLSNLEAFHIVLRSVTGIGTVTLPMAFAAASIYLGLPFLFFLTVLLVYGIHLLVKNMQEASARSGRSLALAEAVTFAFSEGSGCCKVCGKILGVIVNILLIFTHFGLGILHILFVALATATFVNTYVDSIEIRYFTAAVGILLIPVFLIRKLSSMILLNITANCLLYLGVGTAIFYYFFMFYKSGLSSCDWRVYSYEYTPLFFGFVLFAITSVGVMATVPAKMEDPDKYLTVLGTLNIVSIIVFFTNVLLGFVVSFTYCEPMCLPFQENLDIINQFCGLALSCILIAVYLSFPVIGYVPIEIIMTQYVLKGREVKHPVIIEYIIRIIFLILCTACATGLPRFEPVIKIFGALAMSLLNIILPVCMDLFLNKSESISRTLGHILLFPCGIIILFLGLYSAYYDMRVYYFSEPVKKNLWEVCDDHLM